MCKFLPAVIALLLPFISIGAAEPTKGKLQMLYASLDPLSVGQHLAFWELYKSSDAGKKSLQDAWGLLTRHSPSEDTLKALPIHLPTEVISQLVELLTQSSAGGGAGAGAITALALDDAALHTIDMLANHLPNRRLKGWAACSEEELLALHADEIDLGRALSLSSDTTEQGAFCSALLDLMALQVAARLPKNCCAAQIIRALNDFIFREQGFRFPPQSQYMQDIDLYTLLPSVLDKRKGVCLGISLLYLCLAQRLNLPLEVVTPPGHIYVRYRAPDELINIETTARGMQLDNEDYMGIENKGLQQRDIKEVVGLVHMNAAAVWWQRGDYAKALSFYERARPYLPEDMLLTELMGYQFIFLGQEDKGKELLERVRHHLPAERISRTPIAEDYLTGNVDKEGVQAIFLPNDDNRVALMAKKLQIEKVLERHPRFRSGLFALAGIWLQLHRYKEAINCLERYQILDRSDIAVEYYLAMLYFERRNFPQAWQQLHSSESLAKRCGYTPKELTALRRALATNSPE